MTTEPLKEVMKLPLLYNVKILNIRFSEAVFKCCHLFLCSHNTRTTQWEDPRMQTASAAVSHGNLFSSSEHSSVETLFSSPTNLSSLGSSQNGNHFISISLNLEAVTKQKTYFKGSLPFSSFPNAIVTYS